MTAFETSLRDLILQAGFVGLLHSCRLITSRLKQAAALYSRKPVTRARGGRILGHLVPTAFEVVCSR